jgi:hypothetical protein
MHETADTRARLTHAITDLDDALHRTRPERVAAATLDPTSDMWHLLGPPPSTRGGLNAWCGIAEHLTTHHDTHPTHRVAVDRMLEDLGGWDRSRWFDRSGYPPQDRATTLVRDAGRIISVASQLDPTVAPDPLADGERWQPAVETASRTLAVERRQQTVEHDLGFDLGL